MRRTWLRELRKAHGMTQEDLAKRMGKERSAISKYETGVCDLPGRVLQEYAAIFAMTMDDIYRRVAADSAHVMANGHAVADQVATCAPLPPPPTPRAAVHALAPRRRGSRAPH